MSKNNGNILLPLLTGALVVAIAATAFFFWQNQNNLNSIDPDPRTVSPIPTSPIDPNAKMANWKTYYNNADGFSLKYPLTWETEELTENWVVFFPKDSTHDFSAGGNLQFQIQAAEDTRPLDYLKSEYFATATKSTIGGKPALILKDWTIVKPSETRGIEITAFSKEAIKSLDQILSTFKFTDEMSDVDFLRSYPLLKGYTADFPFNLGPEKTIQTKILKSDYGPPFDPGLFALVTDSNYLLAISKNVNLEDFIDQQAEVTYKDVEGVLMTELQLVLVDSVKPL